MKTKILISLLTLTCLLAAPATAQVNYAVSGGSAYVTSSPNASGNIVIASTYQGKPVTSIGDDAFYNCHNLTSVTIRTWFRSADLQSAVSPSCTRPGDGMLKPPPNSPPPAGCKPAIQQIKNLRYNCHQTNCLHNVPDVAQTCSLPYRRVALGKA